jgi:hypothetical protein
VARAHDVYAVLATPVWSSARIPRREFPVAVSCRRPSLRFPHGESKVCSARLPWPCFVPDARHSMRLVPDAIKCTALLLRHDHVHVIVPSWHRAVARCTQQCSPNSRPTDVHLSCESRPPIESCILACLDVGKLINVMGTRDETTTFGRYCELVVLPCKPMRSLPSKHRTQNSDVIMRQMLRLRTSPWPGTVEVGKRMAGVTEVSPLDLRRVLAPLVHEGPHALELSPCVPRLLVSSGFLPGGKRDSALRPTVVRADITILLDSFLVFFSPPCHCQGIGASAMAVQVSASPSSLRDQPPPSATVLLVQRLSSVPTHHEVRRRLPRGYALCARGGGVVPPLLPACALRSSSGWAGIG